MFSNIGSCAISYGDTSSTEIAKLEIAEIATMDDDNIIISFRFRCIYAMTEESGQTPKNCTILFLIAVLFVTAQYWLVQPYASTWTPTQMFPQYISSNANDIFNFSNATQCRLDLERKQNYFIDKWLEAQVPILESVILIDDVYHIIMVFRHLKKSDAIYTWRNASWFCGSQQSKQQQNPVQVIQQNTSNVVLLQCPFHLNIGAVWPSVNSNVTGRAPEYDIRHMIHCDNLDRSSYDKSELVIGSLNENIKIGSCLMFRGNEDRKKVAKWIAYHRLIGISHFWVYLNEKWNLKDLPTLPYVTYIPYNYFWKDHAAHSKHFQPRKHEIVWQQPMLHQCLYRAKSYSFDWIVTTDLDEYIWVTHSTAIVGAANIASSHQYPALVSFLASDFANNNSDIGSLVMNSIPFGRNPSQEPETRSLDIDYVFRNKNNPPWEFRGKRWKNFYHVATAVELDVHFLRRGGTSVFLDPDSQARINHYKTPSKGVWHTQNLKNLKRDSSLPDLYREKVLRLVNVSS